MLTPYLHAASVVSLSLFFTCSVEIFSRKCWACAVDIPAFSAAWGDKEEHAAETALWEWKETLFFSFSVLKFSWKDLCPTTSHRLSSLVKTNCLLSPKSGGKWKRQRARRSHSHRNRTRWHRRGRLASFFHFTMRTQHTTTTYYLLRGTDFVNSSIKCHSSRIQARNAFFPLCLRITNSLRVGSESCRIS